MWLKHRPHRPRHPPQRQNTCKTPYLYAVDKRAILAGAVGNGLLAVDKPWLVPPAESPANKLITDPAGDAGGILLDVVLGAHPLRRFQSPLL
jgi:hypothetical protein